jgi:hypothetical protein
MTPALVDIAAIAERLDVPKDTVHKWRFRGILPAPDFDLSMGPAWWWDTIEEWAKATGRLGTATVPPAVTKGTATVTPAVTSGGTAIKP